jgi:hypothetical protein
MQNRGHYGCGALLHAGSSLALIPLTDPSVRTFISKMARSQPSARAEIGWFWFSAEASGLGSPIRYTLW